MPFNISIRISILLIAQLIAFQNKGISQDKTPFDFLDLFELQYASTPVISEDGAQIAYLRNHFDIMTDRKYSNLWISNFEGNHQAAISSGRQNISSPAWSPNSDRIAYVNSADGKAQIFVHRIATGQSFVISNLTQAPINIRWSPDGKWISFSMFVPAPQPKLGKAPAPPENANWATPPRLIDQAQFRSDGNQGFNEPGYYHVFMISSDGGTIKQLTSGNFHHSGSEWAPDGNSIIFSANRNPDADFDPSNTHIFELQVGDLSIRQVTSGRGPNSEPTISGNGKWIAFTGSEEPLTGYRQDKLFVMNRDGSERKEMATGLDVDCSNPVWAQNNESLYIQYIRQGRGCFTNIRLDGTSIEVLNDVGGASYGRPYSGGSCSIAKNGRYAYTQGNPYQPAEIACGQFPTKAVAKRITYLNDLFLGTKKLGKVEEVWFKSSFDQKDVQGWVVYPPDFDPAKKYPLILEIHGGPYLSYGPVFTAEIQLMATQGYIVLYTNPRGSTSYGVDFASYINHNYPSEDYDDLMSGIDHVVSKGSVDTDRLYITGGSGGGILTAWSIARTDRFAAAVISKPVINWYSTLLNSDMSVGSVGYWFEKKPWEDAEEYMKRSPISYVDKVKTPAMLICGEQDFRTPMSESEQYYNALKLVGVATMLIRFPETSHDITQRPGNLIRMVSYITGWFDKYSKAN